jgi:hypothetical protein
MGGGGCGLKIKAPFSRGYQRDGHPYDKFVIAQWQLLQMAPIPIKGLSILSDYHCLPVEQLADGVGLPPETIVRELPQEHPKRSAIFQYRYL